MQNNAFVTGSQVFGYATKSSDIDLVILLPREQICLLAEILRENDPSEDLEYLEFADGMGGWKSLRAGPLNLICCWEQFAFDVFSLARSTVLAKRVKGDVITKEVSVAVHEKIKDAVNEQQKALQTPWFLG